MCNRRSIAAGFFHWSIAFSIIGGYNILVMCVGVGLLYEKC